MADSGRVYPRKGKKSKKKEGKDTRRMPRHLEAMKDVASCDKLRVDASSLRSEDFRMGQPTCFGRYSVRKANAEN